MPGHDAGHCVLRALYHQQAIRQVARGSKDRELLREVYGTAAGRVSKHEEHCVNLSVNPSEDNQPMKFKSIAVCTVLIVLAFLIPASAQIQNNGNLTQSSLYGNWIDTTLNAVSSGAQTISLSTCYFRAQSLGINQGSNPPAGQGMSSLFFPFGTNVPITIVDGANTETVTPSAVATPTVASPSSVQPYACSVTATLSNAHGAGVTVISGDGGLAEAANDNGKAYGITAGADTLAGGCTGTATASQTLGLFGAGQYAATTCTSTVVNLGQTMKRAGVAKNLYCTASAGGVSSSSGVVTLDQVHQTTNATTALTCTFGTGTSCKDTTHSVTFAAGDQLSIQFTTQGSETLANVACTAELF